MGENYFLTIGNDKTCYHCGHTTKTKKLHIGKSSVGWCFGLHVEVDDPTHPMDLTEWRVAFEDGVITNEYDDVISRNEMLDKITKRSCSYGTPTEQWLQENNAVIGPGSLVRHQLGDYCIAHGDSTYDLLAGWFR